MLIRYGYEITVHCEHPTAMVCLLSVSEDRKIDIRVPEKVFTTPIIATATYVDSFGNRCRRLVAPSGDLTIWGDATIEDDGKIDPADFAAADVPVAELPDSCLLCLMGSRYCETDKLSQVAWDLFGKIPPAGGTCRRFAISCIGTSSLTICRRDRPERRLKPSMNVSECVETSPISRSRFAAASTFRLATSMAISATLACPSWTRWISARGSRFSSTGRGGHSILATTSHGSGGSSSLEAGTRQISRSSTRSGRMSSSLFGSGHTRSSIR